MMRYARSIAITQRHQQLLALIRRGSLSSPHLAGELGVSEQTVYRDILFLRRQGYPIKSVRLSTNWAYCFVPPSQSPTQPFKEAT